jgi:hypothetical protein
VFAGILMSPVLSGPASAEVILKPLLTTSVRLEDNYFLSEDNKHQVMTYLVQPGIDLGYKEANTLANFHYTLDNFFYDDEKTDLGPNQRSADEDNFTGHSLNFNGRYRAFKRLLTGVDEDFMVTRDPAQSDRFNNSISREKYTMNRIVPMLFYDFGYKFTLGVRYRNTLFDYSNNDMEDSVNNAGIVDFIYNFNRTLALDAEYQYSQMDYDLGTPDYTADQFKLILKKTFRLITVDIGAGYNRRSFDSTGGDIDDIVYHVNVITAPDLLSGPRLNFSYDTNYNDIGNTIEVGQSYYLAHRFDLELVYDLSKSFFTGIDAYYQISDYVNDTRKDKTYDMSANIGYMFARWLKATLTGGYANRDSNIPGYNYDDTYFVLTLNAAHDFGKK